VSTGQALLGRSDVEILAYSLSVGSWNDLHLGCPKLAAKASASWRVLSFGPGFAEGSPR